MMKEREVVMMVEGLTVRRLRAWVRQGWVRPLHRDNERVYSEVDTARLRLICHLRGELNVNEDAMPVILSLMDQLYGVRHEMRCLVQALDSQPRGVKDEVLAHVRRLKGDRE
jgi:chaperone modulatory protein CbpM